MKRIILSITIALLAWLSFSCRGSSPTAPGSSTPQLRSRALSAGEATLANAGNDFSFRLFSQLAAERPDSNVFCSPLSVSMALGMTINGARGNTFDSMQACLGFPGMSQEAMNQSYQSLSSYLTALDSKVTMQIGNSIWYATWLTVLPAFMQVNQTYFHAAITSLDFGNPASAGIINAWIFQNTNGKFKDVIQPPIPGDVAMYLINTLYFKGTWKYAFPADSTYDAQFTPSPGSAHPCRMMREDVTVPVLSYQGVTGVDLPYGDSLFSMTLILPPAGTNVHSFLQTMSGPSWNVMMGQFKTDSLSLHLPKFHVEYGDSLKKSLSTLGMGIAFEDHADFTGIDPTGGLCISDVIHKTYVQVDEEGTEAAAVTVVVMTRSSIGGGRKVIIFNRPFLYAIREIRSGTILFLGVMEQPVF